MRAFPLSTPLSIRSLFCCARLRSASFVDGGGAFRGFGTLFRFSLGGCLSPQSLLVIYCALGECESDSIVPMPVFGGTGLRTKNLTWGLYRPSHKKSHVGSVPAFAQKISRGVCTGLRTKNPTRACTGKIVTGLIRRK